MTDEFRPGDYVKMINCYEAKLNPDKIWVVRSKPWELGHGEKVVLLEGKTGGFACDCLKLFMKSQYPDHVLYRPDDPEIQDNEFLLNLVKNGISICKKCGKCESRLSEPCNREVQE